MNSISPFKVQRTLNQVGKLKNVKRLRDGTILIQTFTKVQAEALVKINKIETFDVKIVYHPHFNQSKGVVSDISLSHIDTNELLDELKDQNVIDIKRIQRRDGEKKVNTGTCVLTFNSTQKPDSIECGYAKLRVRTFIPNPTRCFKCQKYGHITLSCKDSEICGKCSDSTHGSAECNNSPKCNNCDGNHPSWSRQCPKFKTELDIQKIKVTNNVSAFIARKMYRERQQFSSYSAAARPDISISQANNQNNSSPRSHYQALNRSQERNDISNNNTNIELNKNNEHALITQHNTQTESQNRTINKHNKNTESSTKLMRTNSHNYNYESEKITNTTSSNVLQQASTIIFKSQNMQHDQFTDIISQNITQIPTKSTNNLSHIPSSSTSHLLTTIPIDESTINLSADDDDEMK